MARYTIVVCLLAVCGLALGKRYCQEDTDCDVIGDLTCQKSLCTTWGICGCPRGQASRFVGSSLKFQCVTLKKIGESCSTDGTDGLCGPDNSYCEDGKCRCPDNSYSIWDGERCSTTVGTANSETCSDSLGDCGFDTSTCRSEIWWTLSTSPFDGVPTTCACPDGQHTKIPNDYTTSEFVGRREPECVDIAVGDTCLRDADCNNIGGNGATCNGNFVCECSSGSPYAEGTICGTVVGLNSVCYVGASGTTSNCAMNMVCGDVCDIKNYIDTSVDRTCQCAPGYNEAGSSCVAISAGSTCSGDAMCKGLGYDSLCLDGVCQSGSSTAVLSVTILLLALITNTFWH